MNLGDNKIAGSLPDRCAAGRVGGQGVHGGRVRGPCPGTRPPKSRALMGARGAGKHSQPVEKQSGTTANCHHAYPARSWTALSKLSSLNVSSNAIVGDMPPDYTALKSLTALLIADNKITGVLPARWALRLALQGCLPGACQGTRLQKQSAAIGKQRHAGSACRHIGG